MQYDFETVINRKGSNSLKWDAGEAMAKMGMTERFDEKTIPAFTADMDFRCAQPIIDAIKETVEHGIFGYTTLAAADQYFKAAIEWFSKRYNWEVSREEVVYVNGTVEAVKKAVIAFTKEGEGVLIMRPVYFPFTGIIESNNRKLVNCQLKNDGNGYYTIDFEDFEQKASEDNIKAFILCNPHNPVGRVWSKEELEKIIDICKRNHIIILADEIHGDLRRKDVTFYPIASLCEDDSNIITFTAVNKTFNLAGLQMTNVVIPDPNRKQQYQKVVGHVSPSPFGISALIAAYTKCDDWLEQLNTYLDENIDWVIEFLSKEMPKMICCRPEGTYILWMDFRGYGLSAKEIRKKIYVDANVFLEGGVMFDPEQGNGFERICVPMSRSVLKEVFHRIKNEFEN